MPGLDGDGVVVRTSRGDARECHPILSRNARMTTPFPTPADRRLGPPTRRRSVRTVALACVLVSAPAFAQTRPSHCERATEGGPWPAVAAEDAARLTPRE